MSANDRTTYLVQAFRNSYHLLRDRIGDIAARALQLIFLQLPLDNLSLMLPPHLRNGHNSRPQPRPSPSPPEQTPEQSPDQHFPRHPRHVYSALQTLRIASNGRLSDELLKPILYHADYDCVHYRVTSSAQSSRHSSGPETQPRPYIETGQLQWLGDFELAQHDGQSVQKLNGRLRTISIAVTGRDQGWCGDRNAGSWSWFELGMTRANTTRLERRGWKWNSIGDMSWKTHSMLYHVDEELSDANADMGTWFSTLQSGDRLSVIPMARFSGWSCNVSKAHIDVEIEVWR